MNLTADQQKTIYSLIDNSTSSDYVEIRDELYDHFISGITSCMKDGMSFTESLNSVYNELDGEKGMCRIEAGYIKMTKSLGKSFYRKFARQYLQSFRWLAAILPAILIAIIPSAFLPFPIGALNMIFHGYAIFYGLMSFRNWRLAGEQSSYYNEKKSLKAVTAYNFYITPIMAMPMFTFISGHSQGIVLFASSAVLYIILDYSLSLIKYMKRNWLLPEMNLA